MSLNVDDEKNLLVAAKSGDLDAFEKILFKYERGIFGYIYRMVSQKQDAEDLTQDTFVKLYKNRANIDTERNFKSWLYKIATNTVYDWLRQKKRTPKIEPLDESELRFETIEAGGTYYYTGSTNDNDIEASLQKIKPIYKTVLLLLYREGLTYQEIADSLNLPINTVKTYLRRAKQDLKKALEKNG